MTATACAATRRDGSPCRSQVLGDAALCWIHDPRNATLHAAARRKGGTMRSHAARLQKIMPARLLPVWDALEAALTEVHDGTLDPRRAAAMAALARALAAVLQAGEIEERLRALEERAG